MKIGRDLTPSVSFGALAEPRVLSTRPRRNDISTTVAYGAQPEEIIMSALTPALPKRDTLNIRIRPEERNLIDRAASVRGKTRTDFVLEAARLAAEEVVLDQRLIAVDPDAYAAFLDRLDRPAQPSDRLRRTMQTPLPWDPT